MSKHVEKLIAKRQRFAARMRTNIQRLQFANGINRILKGLLERYYQDVYPSVQKGATGSRVRHTELAGSYRV